MKHSEFGIIIADKNGKILECNEMSKLLLETDDVEGKNIKVIYRSGILTEDIWVTKLGEKEAYLISNGNFGLLKYILDMNSTAFAVCNGSGEITYCNALFSSILPVFGEERPSENIEDLLKPYCKEWFGLKLVEQARKEISVKIEIENQSFIVLLKPVFGKADKMSHLLVSCTYSKEVNLLKKELSHLRRELNALKTHRKPEEQLQEPKIVMSSKQMAEIDGLLQNLATKDITVLLLGHSGTGKSFMAKNIHNQSQRKNMPMITINCSAIPDSLMESELFGYEKGAFTGALASGKKGLIEMANGGTLFLDEIAEIPLQMQSKLLQLIQERTFLPVGGTAEKRVDIRIIAATNKNLTEAVKNGTFREDLYYRIAVAVVNIPPLSDRKEDVESITETLLSYFNRKHGKKIRIIGEAKAILLKYSWPGNIRELEHLLEFLVLCNDMDIQVNDLPYHILQEVHGKNGEGALDREQIDSLVTENSMPVIPWEKEQQEYRKSYECSRSANFDQVMEAYESNLIKHFYKTNNSSYKLAKALCISQTKANKLIQKHVKTGTSQGGEEEIRRTTDE